MIKRYFWAGLVLVPACHLFAADVLNESLDVPLSTEDLLNMPLEQVMEISITTSVSRKQQNVHDSAAAVFVISAEDIRRSGATSVPEALRMAPGLEVARINANQWAVSIRGSSERTANKLLVLMDGRTLFFPGFSGTLWETLDMLMENIERIEVIRGPGATLWGANAVNGVINIISKHAKSTQGAELIATGGDQQAFASARYGFQIDQNSYGRVHFQGKKHDNFRDSNGVDYYDAWEAEQGGAQLDLSDGDDDRVKIQSNFFRGRFQDQSQMPQLTAPYVTAGHKQEDSLMFSLLSRWDKTLSADSDFSLQAYYDYQQHEFYLPSNFHQFDLDFQHHFKAFERHDFIWGAGYRFIKDWYGNNTLYQFYPGHRTYQLFSGFAQDEITLIEDRLKFILGAKLEHNDFSGLQFLPNVRLILTPNSQHSFWGAVSKAATVPARNKQFMDIWWNTVPPSAATGGLPVKVEGLASLTPEQYKSEEVIAYELGYHFQGRKANADISLFYNDYRRLPYLFPGTPYATVSETGLPYILQPLGLINDVKGYTYGGELSGAWQATEYWKLHLSYGFLETRFKQSNGSLNSLSYGNPQNVLSLRSSFDVTDDLELDLWFRYVDKLAYVDIKPVSDYSSLTARVAYRPIDNFELSLVGNNLIQRHAEFNPDIPIGNYASTILAPHFYIKARLDF